jgi:biotin synthase-related radical SAM superfamily protein
MKKTMSSNLHEVSQRVKDLQVNIKDIEADNQLTVDQLKNQLIHYKERYQMLKTELQQIHLPKVKAIIQHCVLTASHQHPENRLASSQAASLVTSKMKQMIREKLPLGHFVLDDDFF